MAKLLKGMFLRISSLSVTEAVSEDLTSTVGDWAITVTCSSTVATCNFTVRVSLMVVSSRMSSWTYLLNPGSSAESKYIPGGRAGKRKFPLVSVTKDRSPISLSLLRVTVTPGRGTFSSSVTTPVMAPVPLDWDITKEERIKHKTTENKTILDFIFTP